VATALALVACGGGEDTPPPPESMEEAMQQATEMTKAAGDVEPLSGSQLLERLPASLSGFTRGEPEHQDIAAMGMKMSSAKATYTGDDGRIDVSLTDTGGASQMAPMAAGWAMVEFDRTTSTGYERTIRFEGFKGHEELSEGGGRTRTELSLLLGDRIVLQLKGSGVTMDQLKDVARAMDLRGLARAS
jgi:hypothetical protein